MERERSEQRQTDEMTARERSERDDENNKAKPALFETDLILVVLDPTKPQQFACHSHGPYHNKL